MTQEIFFAHANGFPSASYSKLFAALGAGFRIDYLEQHAHDERFPVDDNWTALVDELLYHLEQRDRPVWGVGHSLGGVLHYHAALRRPELYRGVVMLDSPVLARSEQLLVQTAKRVGMIDRITPAARTLGRRAYFDSPEQARQYFAGKGLFRGFDPDCLAAYVEHGLLPENGRYRLRFDPDTEVKIYRSIPHKNPGRVDDLQVPLAVLRGDRSTVVKPRHQRVLRGLKDSQFLTLPGGHMFPFERPEETAQLLRQVFNQWQGTSHKE